MMVRQLGETHPNYLTQSENNKTGGADYALPLYSEEKIITCGEFEEKIIICALIEENIIIYV